MRMVASNHVPKYLLIGCTFIGAFIGFLMPEAKLPQPESSGIVSAIIRFELSYINFITTLGAGVLAYLLFKRKVSGRAAMILYGALGFVCVRLLLASLIFAHKP